MRGRSLQPSSREQLKKWSLASLFTALTAVGAFIKIPLPYVPITLQVFFVILAADLLGSKYGAISQGMYLILGLVGLPVFAYGGGPGYLLQPTFGYLLGCPLAAYIVGFLVEKFYPNQIPHQVLGTQNRLRFLRLLFFNSCGVGIIFFVGVAYLYININWIVGKSLSFENALWAGFVVFLPGETIKIIIASFVADKLKRMSLF